MLHVELPSQIDCSLGLHRLVKALGCEACFHAFRQDPTSTEVLEGSSEGSAQDPVRSLLQNAAASLTHKRFNFTSLEVPRHHPDSLNLLVRRVVESEDNLTRGVSNFVNVVLAQRS